MTPPYDSSDGSDSSNQETTVPETTVPETTTTTPPVEDYSDCIPGRLLVGFSNYETIDLITPLGYDYEAAFDTTPLTGGSFIFDANSKTVATAIAEVQAVSGVTYAECDTTVTTTTTTPPAEDPDPTESTTSENTLPKTTLSSGVSVGETTLPVASTDGFDAGDTIIIDKGTDVEETGVIASISSIVLTEGLQYAHEANASVEKVEVVDCSTIPQNCRTTIDELTDATTSEDTDEFVVSRGGEAFKVSMNEMIENIINDQRLLDKVTEIVDQNQPTPPAEEPEPEPVNELGGFIDCVQCLHEGGTRYSHQYSDFDPDTQVCVVITNKDEEGVIGGFPNLRLVPISDNVLDKMEIAPGTTPFPVTIYVTRAGKLNSTATVGVMRFRRPT